MLYMQKAPAIGCRPVESEGTDRPSQTGERSQCSVTTLSLSDKLRRLSADQVLQFTFIKLASYAAKQLRN